LTPATPAASTLGGDAGMAGEPRRRSPSIRPGGCRSPSTTVSESRPWRP